jgi:hypothetical protein
MRTTTNPYKILTLCVLTFVFTDASSASDNFPRGSWSQSCSNPSMRGSVMRATCVKIDGTSAKSSLNLADCRRRSTVSNIDGHLACDRSDSFQMPNGSWAASCKDWSMKGRLLRATCGKIDGTWIAATLDVGDCVGTVSNRDGRLKCD